jgi:hypothetical protein
VQDQFEPCIFALLNSEITITEDNKTITFCRILVRLAKDKRKLVIRDIFVRKQVELDVLELKIDQLVISDPPENQICFFTIRRNLPSPKCNGCSRVRSEIEPLGDGEVFDGFSAVKVDHDELEIGGEHR